MVLLYNECNEMDPDLTTGSGRELFHRKKMTPQSGYTRKRT